MVTEYLDWGSVSRNEIATGFLSSLSETRAANVWRLHLVRAFPSTIGFAYLLQEPRALARAMNFAPSKGTNRRLDSALVFCGGAEYGTFSRYRPKNMLQKRSNVFCSRSYHRRFLVVHDLGKPCVITGLEVHSSGFCSSNLRTVRIAATDRVPHWVQQVGAAQETELNVKIKPEQDYTKNVLHPASQLRWVELKDKRYLNTRQDVGLALSAALCGRFVMFYCIDGELGLKSNIDIGFMQVHGYPVKLSRSLPATSETDSALVRLQALTAELTRRALGDAEIDDFLHYLRP